MTRQTVPARIVALSAGVHEPSATRNLAMALADAAVAAVARRGIAAEMVEVQLRDLATDLAAACVGGAPSVALTTAIEAVTGADAVVAVTPVFAASYAGLFKSFFDLLDPLALVGMPVVIGATGGSLRHSLALDHAVRPLLAYFRASVAATAVFATPADSEASACAARLAARVGRAGDELGDLMTARVRDVVTTAARVEERV